MAKSKIIKDLISDSIPLTQALDRLLVIAMELEDKEILQWIKSEKNGYDDRSQVPRYRYIKLIPIGTYQMLYAGGLHTFKNHPLATIGISENIKADWNNFPLQQSVAQLLSDKISFSKGQQVYFPLPPEFYVFFEKGTNSKICNAQLNISELDIDRILEDIKTKVIEMLVVLEKNFGCLDSLDINIDDYDANELNRLKKVLDEIKDGKNSGDTYIISHSKIKSSNIGENNSQEKKTTTEISPNINIEKKQPKQGFFSKFKSLFTKHK